MGSYLYIDKIYWHYLNFYLLVLVTWWGWWKWPLLHQITKESFAKLLITPQDWSLTSTKCEHSDIKGVHPTHQLDLNWLGPTQPDVSSLYFVGWWVWLGPIFFFFWKLILVGFTLANFLFKLPRPNQGFQQFEKVFLF